MGKRYPQAKQDVSGRMTTQGSYAGGFPRGAIVHFTAGGPSGQGTAEGGIRNKFCFFVIAPNGDVYQNFDLDRWGSHAGVSSYPGLGTRVSQYLVGIEVCNAGKLRQMDENTFRPWFNDPDYYRRQRKPVPAGVPNPTRDYRCEQVLLYCESGLKRSGHVDPDHRHSEGERGLLPLPENVRFWNGSDAPAWKQTDAPPAQRRAVFPLSRQPQEQGRDDGRDTPAGPGKKRGRRTGARVNR